MDLGLAGRRAVVTGGSKGLGKAIAAELLAEGAQVVICSRDEAELEATAAELRKPGGTVFAFRCDVTDPGQVTAFLDEAGVRPGRRSTSWSTTPAPRGPAGSSRCPTPTGG